MRSILVLVAVLAMSGVALAQQPICPPNCPCKLVSNDANVGDVMPRACLPSAEMPKACTPVNGQYFAPQAPQTVYQQTAPVYQTQEAPIFLGTFMEGADGNLTPMNQGEGNQNQGAGLFGAGIDFGKGGILAASQNGRAAFHATRASSLGRSANVNMMRGYNMQPTSGFGGGYGSYAPRSNCPGGNCPKQSYGW